jgi:F0F1-type ATP synthase beta subunit
MTKPFVGAVQSVIGPVVDFVFPEGALPEIYDAVWVEKDNGTREMFEVEQQLGDGVVRSVARARKLQRFLTQPLFVAEQFTGRTGTFVKVADTVRGCRAILDGNCDDLPEMAFYMVGDLQEAMVKTETLRAGVL